VETTSFTTKADLRAYITSHLEAYDQAGALNWTLPAAVELATQRWLDGVARPYGRELTGWELEELDGIIFSTGEECALHADASDLLADLLATREDWLAGSIPGDPEGLADAFLYYGLIDALNDGGEDVACASLAALSTAAADRWWAFEYGAMQDTPDDRPAVYVDTIRYPKEVSVFADGSALAYYRSVTPMLAYADWRDALANLSAEPEWDGTTPQYSVRYTAPEHEALADAVASALAARGILAGTPKA
jgi:hypothetical protein